MKVQIIGSGVVGQATGRGLHKKGHDVVFVDTDDKIVTSLSQDGYSSCNTPVHGQEVTLVSVPTPTINRKIELSYLEAATSAVGETITGDDYQLVVVRSTVPPGTVENTIRPILEDVSGLKAGRDFGLCMNPEFLRAESPEQDFLNPPAIVIGEYDGRSGDVLEKMYGVFNGVPVVRLPINAAELVKYTSNVFGALKITYFNVIGKIAEANGIDPELVTNIVTNYSHVLTNARYGSTPGRPYAGMCFPKDTLSFIEFVKSNGTAKWADILVAMDQTNRMVASECGELIPEYA